MLYVRKINDIAWFEGVSLDADAVSELRTSEHTLSVWQLPNDKHNLDDIALALALSRDKVDEMYIVFIDIDVIKDLYDWDLELLPEDGVTSYEKMRSHHTNFKIETFWELGFLAEHIKNLLANPENYIYYCALDLVRLLYSAVKNGDITRSEIKKIGRWNKSLKDVEKELGELS